MKRKLSSLVVLGVMLFSSLAHSANSYIKSESGAIGLGVIKGHSQGFRIGIENDDYDFQFGYSRDEGDLDSKRVLANEAVVSSVIGEVSKKIALPYSFSVLAGIGAGFSSVNLNKNDKAESGILTTAGIETRYTINRNLYVGLSLKGQILTVNTTRTDYSSRVVEIQKDGVPTGDYAEVLETYPTSNRLDLSSGKALISLVWKFE